MPLRRDWMYSLARGRFMASNASSPAGIAKDLGCSDKRRWPSLATSAVQGVLPGGKLKCPDCASSSAPSFHLAGICVRRLRPFPVLGGGLCGPTIWWGRSASGRREGPAGPLRPGAVTSLAGGRAVTVGDGVPFRKRVEEKGVAPERVHVLPIRGDTRPSLYRPSPEEPPPNPSPSPGGTGLFRVGYLGKTFGAGQALSQVNFDAAPFWRQRGWRGALSLVGRRPGAEKAGGAGTGGRTEHLSTTPPIPKEQTRPSSYTLRPGPGPPGPHPVSRKRSLEALRDPGRSPRPVAGHVWKRRGGGRIWRGAGVGGGFRAGTPRTAGRSHPAVEWRRSPAVLLGDGGSGAGSNVGRSIPLAPIADRYMEFAAAGRWHGKGRGGGYN